MTPADRVRRWTPWALIGALLVLLGLAGQTGGPGPALDPNGTGPNGAKALVLLLRHYGAVVSVDTGVPPPGVTTAVILNDQLDTRRRGQVAAWVRGGGRLVVADPRSQLQPGVPTPVGSGLVAQDLEPVGPCPALGLGDVERLAVGPSLLLRVPPGESAVTCFDANLDNGDQVSFLISVDSGRGSVVGLGGAGVWSNARLDQQDNGALAVDLLAPAAGDHVDILGASLAGSGTQSLLGLLNPRLKSALVQLLIAFAVLAWWRGRQLGRPVEETHPVSIAASEIVTAVGDLMARTGSRAAAGTELRGGTRRWAGERLGLGTRASPEQVAEAAGARIGADPRAVVALLAGPPVPDDASLVRLAQSLTQFREEVARGRSQAVR